MFESTRSSVVGHEPHADPYLIVGHRGDEAGSWQVGWRFGVNKRKTVANSVPPVGSSFVRVNDETYRMASAEFDRGRYCVENLVLVSGGLDFGDYGRKGLRNDFTGERAPDAVAEQ